MSSSVEQKKNQVKGVSSSAFVGDSKRTTMIDQEEKDNVVGLDQKEEEGEEQEQKPDPEQEKALEEDDLPMFAPNVETYRHLMQLTEKQRSWMKINSILFFCCNCTIFLMLCILHLHALAIIYLLLALYHSFVFIDHEYAIADYAMGYAVLAPGFNFVIPFITRITRRSVHFKRNITVGNINIVKVPENHLGVATLEGHNVFLKPGLYFNTEHSFALHNIRPLTSPEIVAWPNRILNVAQGTIQLARNGGKIVAFSPGKHYIKDPTFKSIRTVKTKHKKLVFHVAPLCINDKPVAKFRVSTCFEIGKSEKFAQHFAEGDYTQAIINTIKTNLTKNVKHLFPFSDVGTNRLLKQSKRILARMGIRLTRCDILDVGLMGDQEEDPKLLKERTLLYFS